MVLGSKPGTGERFFFFSNKCRLAKYFSVPQKVQTTSGVHPSSVPGSNVTGA